ncbi:MAG: hypothetical protein JKY54_07920 [Flavobacteriales bacterium]|nr:hypothetical protein [Flavobacteriales bacterium]
MEKHKIDITTSARYFTLGDPENEEIEEIWFVLHGYGQLANYFLKRFEVLDNGKRLIVAPEGLNRFYWNGFSGRVVASWMTKEDREVDIINYVHYLDAIYNELVGDRKVKIRLLGFSQGTATACRWALLGKSKFSELILWAGAFPDDIDYFENVDFFNQLDIKFVVGQQDQFYTEDQILGHKKSMEAKGVKFELIEFEGDHNIFDAPLLGLI